MPPSFVDSASPAPFGPKERPALAALQRRGLVNALVVGGDESARLDIVERFHRASAVSSGPIVRLDCSHEEDRLIAAMHSWLGLSSAGPGGNSLWPAVHGTLFLDDVLALSLESQRLLETCLERRQDGSITTGMFGRLIAGCPVDPAHAVQYGHFSAALLDSLDKARVTLGAVSGRRTAHLP